MVEEGYNIEPLSVLYGTLFKGRVYSENDRGGLGGKCLTVWN